MMMKFKFHKKKYDKIIKYNKYKQIIKKNK